MMWSNTRGSESLRVYALGNEALKSRKTRSTGVRDGDGDGDGDG